MRTYIFRFLNIAIRIKAPTESEASSLLACALAQAREQGAKTEYQCWKHARDKGLKL